MKKTILLLLCFSILCVLFGCSDRYQEKDIIGKTSDQIIEIYGKFDCLTMPASEDGLYRNCKCGYLVKASQKGSFGSSEDLLFFIHFDENGIAVKCEVGYRPGG